MPVAVSQSISPRQSSSVRHPVQRPEVESQWAVSPPQSSSFEQGGPTVPPPVPLVPPVAPPPPVPPLPVPSHLGHPHDPSQPVSSGLDAPAQLAVHEPLPHSTSVPSHDAGEPRHSMEHEPFLQWNETSPQPSVPSQI